MTFFPTIQAVMERSPFQPRGQQGRSQRLGRLTMPILSLVGLGFSLLVIYQPLYGAGLVFAIAGLYLFFNHFEQTVIGILCLRSALDFYSNFQVPAAFAIGVDLLVLLYVGRARLLHKAIHTDPFWWFLITWVIIQGFWVALLPTSVLGGTAYMAYEALREWVRFFSLALVYLLTMQLRDRISPDQLISWLFISLIIPLIFALLQSLPIDLPSFLESNVAWQSGPNVAADRISSTLGHYNSFSTFSLLFMALALWRAQVSRQPLGWLLLVVGMLYCVVATKSLMGLVMLLVFSSLYLLPKLRGKSALWALALAVLLGLMLSSGLAQSRLGELSVTPLLNRDLSISRAIALQAADMAEFRNSFNWRLLQWRDLLQQWQLHPWFGYGLASAKKLSAFNTTSHNDYIRFLVEEGIVGLSLFTLFLGAQVAHIVRVMRQSLPGSPQRALSLVLLPFSIAMIVGMLSGNIMVHTATFFYWWVLLALLGWRWPTHLGKTSWTASEISHPISTNLNNGANSDNFNDYSAKKANKSSFYNNYYDKDIYTSDKYDLDTSVVDIYYCDQYNLDSDSPREYPAVDTTAENF